MNGVRAAQKKSFVDWELAEQADIVCIQETKQSPSSCVKISRKSRGIAVTGQNLKKGYSGVGVYTRHEPSEVSTKFHTRFDAEGRVLAMRFDAFTLFNIYFPNGKRSEERPKIQDGLL